MTALVLSVAAAYGLVRLTFDARFALPVPPPWQAGDLVVGLTVVVGLLGSSEVLRAGAPRGAADGVSRRGAGLSARLAP